MCGITGIYNYRTKQPVNSHILSGMVQVIEHRGPDDLGIYEDGSIGLGMRRLSIIDLSGGHQPIHNEDRTIWIVFNGEIYNYPELRAQLQACGHSFYTNSDTETIVHAYEEWGLAAFDRLNGMFGLALWDEKQQQLVLARDHFGVKPLYYFDDGKRLLFGSELKSILQDPTVRAEVDEAALDQYLTFRFVPSPHTLLRGVRKLPPGHLLTVTAQDNRLIRFSRPTRRDLRARSEQELVEELRHLLRSAVRRQMLSDVPVGALLSSGLDSTTVVWLMSQLSTTPVHTFTVGFAEEGDFNELAEARATAEQFGTEHHEIVLSHKDYVGFWPKAVWHLEEPVVTPSVLPMYYVSKLASEHVKVVLTGQGADEPWGGYRRYYGESVGESYRRIPAPLRQSVIAPLVEWMPRNERLKRAVRSLSEQDPAARFARVYAVFTESQKDALYQAGRRQNGGQNGWQRGWEPLVDSVRYWQQDVADLDGVAQMMYVDSRFSLADDLLLYGDKMAMASSLEARVPMLDLELMAFVESLPTALRLHGQTSKYLYRKAVVKWLPAEVLRRPKRGFDTPMDKWLGKDMQAYLNELWFSSDSACSQYFDQSFLRSLLKAHAEQKADYRRQLFSLASFEIWHRIFIQKRTFASIT